MKKMDNGESKWKPIPRRRPAILRSGDHFLARWKNPHDQEWEVTVAYYGWTGICFMVVPLSSVSSLISNPKLIIRPEEWCEIPE